MRGTKVLRGHELCRMAMSVAFSLVLLLTVAIQWTAAQEAFPDYAKDHPVWNDYFSEVASAYSVCSENDLENPFEVTKRPIYSYFTQGQSNYNHGTLFLWTRHGRPEAIASFWCYPIQARVSVNHEWASLSSEPLRATRNGQTIWTPREKGLAFKEVPTGMRPSASREGRLAQMQLIARQFRGFVIRPQKLPANDELQTEQPVFRYEQQDESKETIDGAVFGLFESGDPEMILVVEARNSDPDARWYFAAARFCNKPMFLDYIDQEAWTANPVESAGAEFNTPNDVYYAVHQADIVDLEQLRNQNKSK